MADAQSALKELEDERKELVGPLNSSLKRLNDTFRQFREPIEEFKALVQRKLGEYRLALADAERATLKAAESAAASGDAEGCADALASLGGAQGATGTATTWSWGFELEDLSKVPTQFTMLDEKVVKAYTKKYAKSETIPEVAGLRFFRVASVKSTGKKT